VHVALGADNLVILVASGNLKEFHQLLKYVGGVEAKNASMGDLASATVGVARDLAQVLHERYPLVIKDVQVYFG
jgi:hypothetical protein